MQSKSVFLSQVRFYQDEQSTKTRNKRKVEITNEKQNE